MHVTGPLPQIHLAARAFRDPRSKILIGHEKNISIGRRGAHDFVRIAARANDVALRFHARAAIDVSDDVIIFVRVLLQKGRELFRRTRFRKRTTGLEVRQNHALPRIDDLGGFGHEMNAAEKNHVRVGFRRLIAQA